MNDEINQRNKELENENRARDMERERDRIEELRAADDFSPEDPRTDEDYTDAKYDMI